MPAGLLYVTSHISSPATTTRRLNPETFCAWYENQHIQEVTILSGISGAVRYESIPVPPCPSATPSWLTLYTMPDLDFRHTDEFKGLDGQTTPKGDLLETVFKQARFDTRFYAKVDMTQNRDKVHNSPTCTPAPILLSWCFTPQKSKDVEFKKWWNGDFVRVLQGVEGFVGVKRFAVENATSLDRFVRREESVPGELVLCEFEGKGAIGEVEGLMASARDVVVGQDEVGWWRVKRVYV